MREINIPYPPMGPNFIADIDKLISKENPQKGDVVIIGGFVYIDDPRYFYLDYNPNPRLEAI